MADYVTLRLRAAKVGVSMALLALVAGVAERVGAQQATEAVTVTPASSQHFLKLDGLSGGVRTALIKLEDKWLKLDSALLKLQQKLDRSYLDANRINAGFLKLTDANQQFLKITDANAEFLKLTAANADFLKIGDANAEFLKIDGTAANAQKLDGISADGLIQGKGQVLSNAITNPAGDTLLLGDGSVRILVGLAPGVQGAPQPYIKLANDTSSSLNFTVIGGTSPSSTIPAGSQTTVTTSQPQVDIQIFSAGGGGGAGKIWTATLSQTGNEFVGQLLIGLL
jgi:hypothetical protein